MRIEYGSEDEYLFKICSVYGVFSQLEPASWANADHLWELDTNAYADVLEEVDVTERSKDRL